MKQACVNAVSAVLKRPLTLGEERKIEDTISYAMRAGAAQDPAAWRGLTRDQRMKEAAKIAAKQLVDEAVKKKQRLGEAVMTKAFNENYLNDQVANGFDRNKVDALQRLLAPKYDEKNNAISAESMANGYFAQGVSEIQDVFDAVKPGLWKAIPWQNPRIQRDMRSALAGVTNGIDPTLVKAADAFHKVAEAYREMFNSAGGLIGRLENWDQPHAWSDRLANRYGRDAFVSDMMGWVDRRKYVHEDGSMFNDADMRAFLEEAWLTIASDGHSREVELPFGGSIKANRHSAHRSIHLKADVTADALSKYSERNVLDAMTGHLRQLSRDISLVQRFGPNADLQFSTLLRESVKDGLANLYMINDPDVRARVTGELTDKAQYLQRLYDHLAGNEPTPANQPLADTMAAYRSTKAGSLLGSAAISSISDLATMHATAIQNNLNPFMVTLNSTLAWSPKSRKYMRRAGLMVETVIGEANRYGSENLTSRDISSRVASLAIRASGLNFLTEARRVGFSMTMMDALGSMTRRQADVTKLAAEDRRILAAKGIDQATWDIWRAAKVDKWGGNHTLLTPEMIMAVPGRTENQLRRAVAALLGVVQEEQDIAVITPGARERTQLAMGTTRGTVGGELVRSMLMFKSFPWTVMQRHLERGLNQPGSLDKFAYLAGLFVFMTLLGGAANWINDVRDGKDPRTINPNSEEGLRNIAGAALKGGGLGIYGDFLFADTALGTGTTPAEVAAGPLFSDLGQVTRIGSQAVQQAATGEDTDFDVQSIRFARGFVPGANIWYTKAITDRFIFNALTEAVDPSYLDELEQRQYSQKGTTYWWGIDEQPGFNGNSIDRPPEFEAALAN